MHEELRERFVKLILTGEQAKSALITISNAIGSGDGFYLSETDFENVLLTLTDENEDS